MKNEKKILQHCILNKQHLMVPSIHLDGLGSVYNKKSGFFFQSPTYSQHPLYSEDQAQSPQENYRFDLGK